MTHTYRVAGMTCGHCAAAVTREVSAVPGVSDVAVDLETGTVTLTAAEEPSETELAAAVADAGYTLAGRL